MRAGLELMRSVQGFMLRQGYKSADSERSLTEMMSAAMKGRLGRDVKYLGTMVKCGPWSSGIDTLISRNQETISRQVGYISG